MRMPRLLAAIIGSVSLVWAIRAAVLEVAVPAYVSPDPAAAILGTAPVGARLLAVPAPAGWQAVELPGPHTVFVSERDTLKNFSVRPGASYHVAPRADAAVIGLAGEDDRVQFADIAGRFNKFSLDKPVVAYVRVQSGSAAAPVAVAPVAPVIAAQPRTPATSSPVPASAASPTDEVLRDDISTVAPAAPGRGLGSTEPALARTFFGYVASTRSPLRPRRPHDFQLNDAAGTRIAYLDTTRLLQTERLEAFEGRPVVIFGVASPLVPGSSDIVIRVESIKLQ